MPVRRIQDVEGHGGAVPLLQDRHQLAGVDRRLHHLREMLADAHAGPQQCQQAVAVIGGQFAGLDLQALVATLEDQRIRLCRSCKKVPQAHVLLEVGGRAWRPHPFEIGGRREGAVAQVEQLAADHRHLMEFPGADHAVDAFADDIRGTVADAERQGDVRVFAVEVGQGRDQERSGERSRGIDPEMAARLALLAAHGVVHRVQFSEQAGGLLVVLDALGRCRHRARRPVHQFVAEVDLEIADQLADGGAWQAQLVRSAAERAGVDYAHEGAHGQELVHG